MVLHSSTLRIFVEKQPNLSAEFRVYRGNELRVREVLEDVAQANREASANRGQETVVVDINFQKGKSNKRVLQDTAACG